MNHRPFNILRDEKRKKNVCMRLDKGYSLQWIHVFFSDLGAVTKFDDNTVEFIWF